MNPTLLSYPHLIPTYFEVEFLRFFVIYYFLFQLFFLRRRLLWPFFAATLTTSVYFVVYSQKYELAELFTDPAMGFSFKVSFSLFFFLIYCLFMHMIIKLLPSKKPLNSWRDVYPICLFCPGQKVIQSALEKENQGKIYYALKAFVCYILLTTFFVYGVFYYKKNFYPELFYGMKADFASIPFCLLYLPALFFIFKRKKETSVFVYFLWVVDLFLKDRFFMSMDYHNIPMELRYVCHFLLGAICIRTGMLLAVICKVERERLIKSQKE